MINYKINSYNICHYLGTGIISNILIMIMRL